MPARRGSKRKPRRKVHRRPYATPEVYRILRPRIKALARTAAPYLACLALLLTYRWDTKTSEEPGTGHVSTLAYGSGASEVSHAQC